MTGRGCGADRAARPACEKKHGTPAGGPPGAATAIQQALFALRDERYRAFQCRLMPTVSPAAVLGVRTPDVRRLAGQWAGRPETEAFLAALPHVYYEEYNLHGCLINACGDFRRTVELLDAFLPFVDNWATCDLLRPKIFKKHLPELLPELWRWMGSDEPWAVRFAVEMLMCFYLDGAFCPQYLERVAALRTDEYYVNMMIAWFFATALAKQYAAALPYLENRRLGAWVHGRTIQKAVESFRLSAGQKAYLKTLRGAAAAQTE